MTHRALIRAGLPANQERRPSNRQLARIPFGIYRPVLPEYAERLHEVLTEIKPHVDDFLDQWRTNPAEFTVKNNFGVTYVPKTHIQSVMRRTGLVQRGFCHGLVSEAVQYKIGEAPDLFVSLNDLVWRGGRRQLAVGFEEDEDASKKLREDAAMLRNTLEAINAPEVTVATPEHLSLYSYGNAQDGRGLSAGYRAAISDIVQEHLNENGMGVVALGDFVVGASYNNPNILA